MPTKFDTAQYTANWNPITKGSFVQTQNVMDDVSGMWTKVWSELTDYLGTLTSGSEVDDVVQQSITGLLNELFPSTSGASSSLITELTSWTGVDFNTLETQFDSLFSVSSWDTWLTSDWNTLLSWFGLTPSNVATQAPAVQQSWVTDLETDLASLLDVSTWTTWLTNDYNALLGVFGMGSSTSTPTVQQSWVNGLSSALSAFVTTGNYNPLLTALFGTAAVGSTVQVAALPTNIPQTYISGLSSALTTFLTTGNYNTLLTALFGTASVGSTVQVGALPTNIPQNYVSGLSSALSTFLTTGNYNTLLTALFGTASVGTTVSVAALPTNIPQGNISGLSSALTTFVTTGNYTPLLTSLFGGNFVGSAILPAAVPQLAATKINGVLGSSGGTIGSDLTSFATSLYGSASIGSTIQGAAMPDITSAMSSGIKSLISAIGNALGLGSSVTTVPAISGPLATAVGPCQFRAYSTDTTTQPTLAAAASIFQLPLSTVDYNTGGFVWNSSTNVLTVPNKGVYHFTVGASVHCQTQASVACWVAPLLMRGASVLRYGGAVLWGGSTNATPPVSASFEIEMNAGDTVSPGLFLSGSVTNPYVTADTGGAKTYFEAVCVRVDTSS